MTGVEKVYPEAAESDRGLSHELEGLEAKLDSVKVVPLLQGEVKVIGVDDENEARRAELIARHPQPEIVSSIFADTVNLFDKLENEGRLASGYDAPEGPTIALTNFSVGMVRLNELNRIDPERFDQSLANLAETAFVKLYVKNKDSVSLSGEVEILTLEILALDAERHIASRRQ